jgi:branched-chain amino acid transport system permease protein
LLVSIGISIGFGLMRIINMEQMVYYTFGAYLTYTVLTVTGSFWLGLLCGVILAAFLGFLLTWAICRFQVKGFYFCVSTILIAEILMSIVIRSRYLGRGMGIPFPSVTNAFNPQFISVVPYYYIALSLVVVIVLITRQIEISRMGWYLRATRQSEQPHPHSALTSRR